MAKDEKFSRAIETDKPAFLSPRKSPTKSFSDELQYQTEAESYKRPQPKRKTKRPMKRQ